ncbi:MAG: 50S ribosomal protein L10 [Kangiellaceae bacterium]|nr:50S ribosomal protein L10 [Kangiellaceae bacterium]
MALRLEGKKAIVSEVNAVAKDALSAVVAEYRGLTVEDMTALRVKAREANVYVRVIRNTLARRAVEDTEFACMQEALTGQLVYAFSIDAPGAAARLFKDFAKENNKLAVTGIAIGGELHGPERLDAVAALPTKDEAIASLMMVMNGPITKLARTLNEVPTKITRVMAAVRDQKQAA